MHKKSKNKKIKRGLFLAISILFLAFLGFGSWYIWINKSNAKPDNNVPVSDPGFTGGTDRDISTPVDRDGGIVDTSGDENSENVDQGNGQTSDSGNITVYQPAENSLIASGTSISGKAKGSTVTYRLIDDTIGVIGTGTLKVVSGRFSGKFSFDSQGKVGRLDIFRTLSDGREVDVVEIPVRFK